MRVLSYLVQRPTGCVVACLLLCCGCTSSVDRLANQVKRAGTAEEWRAWAAQMIERSKTNSSEIEWEEMPAFVQRGTPGGARGFVSKDVVIVARFGGFESIGVVIGPPSYEESGDRSRGQMSKQVYLGIYVRESH